MLTSKSNSKIKQFIKDKTDNILFFAEGKKIFQEVISADIALKTIVISEDTLKKTEIIGLINKNYKGTDVLTVDSQVMRSLSDTKEPQGLAFIGFRRLVSPAETLKKISKESVFVILENIGDPGNLGTIIRTCNAAGVSGVFISKGSVSIYNSKVLRATMGSVFNMPVFDDLDIYDIIRKLKSKGVTLLVTDLKANNNFFKTNFSLPVDYAFGNESKGISEKLYFSADVRVKLPILGNIDSLNVGVSAGIVLYDTMKRFELYS